MDRETIKVYRSARAFPPEDDEYVPLAERRSGRKTWGVKERRAAEGLSVFLSLHDAVSNAKRNPRVGSLIVRYNLPRSEGFSLEHLVGNPGHLTLFSADFLQMKRHLDDWWHDLEDSPMNGGEEHNG
jgi:hypothetical protein